jgi:outer membrane protein
MYAETLFLPLMNGFKSRILITAFCVFLCAWATNAFAQTKRVWTLEECIQTALKQNITLKQRQLNSQTARSDLNQSRLAVLPSLNGSVSNIWNVGFVINPITNATERDATFRNNALGVNANMNVFNGFQQSNTIRLQEANAKAAKEDESATRNTIALQVSNAYLQVLLNQEIMQAGAQQIIATRAQLDRQTKLYELGGLNKSRLLQLKAQLANEEFQNVTAEAQLAQAYLNLWQSMNMPMDTNNILAKPEIDAEKIITEVPTTQELYNNFVSKSPEIKAAKMRVRSAELGRYVAAGGRSPRLSFNAGLNSFYTTQNQRGVGNPNLVPLPIGFDINNNPIFRNVPQYSSTEIVPFNDQFNQNLGRNYGFTLGVPIFNGWQVNNNIERSKINRQSAELNMQQVELDLYRNVAQANLDFQAAIKRFQAASINYDAGNEALMMAESQYTAGAIGINDYLLSKNTFVQAETNLLQAKYELLLRRKVLDFYMGVPLY